MADSIGRVNQYNNGQKDFIPFGEQISLIAAKKPNEIALIEIDENGNETESLTWEELDKEGNRIARLLMDRGIEEQDVVAISLPSGIEHILCVLGLWRIGACYFPIHSRSSVELQEIRKLIDIKLFIGEEKVRELDHVTGTKLRLTSKNYPELPLKPVTAWPCKIIVSGGSSGKPKLILHDYPAGNDDKSLSKWMKMSGQKFDQRQLLCGPLYHGAPSGSLAAGLFLANTLIIPVRFHAEQILELIENYEVHHMQVVPTMMVRLLKAKNFSPEKLVSLEGMLHTGSYCGNWLKQQWIQLLGAEKVFEIYSKSEMIGMTIINGSEWLDHPGSVGRPMGEECKISIRDKEGNRLGPHCVGEIYMKPFACHLPTRYIGSKQLVPTEDGFYSVGDMGYVDEKGYLYFCDRRFDMIVTGGENVFSAEVQNAIISHPAIEDAAVIGLPDENWGKRIHAILQADSPVDLESLEQYLKTRLLPYKVPKSYEQVNRLPRGKNGKINLQLLVEERIALNT